ncbi:hypothetical protein L7F22_038317 [Adiantum nelumboides]|nr:hypothetical protein [Adiantum nelumboides]
MCSLAPAQLNRLSIVRWFSAERSKPLAIGRTIISSFLDSCASFLAVAKVLELARVTNRIKNCIIPRHIELAICDDEELVLYWRQAHKIFVLHGFLTKLGKENNCLFVQVNEQNLQLLRELADSSGAIIKRFLEAGSGVDVPTGLGDGNEEDRGGHGGLCRVDGQHSL